MDPDFSEGRRLQAAGDPEGAERAYLRVSAASPDYYKARNNLGMLCEAAGRLEDAVACYLQGIASAPDAALLHYNLGHALSAQQRHRPAAGAYQRALELDPADADAAYNLGHALRSLDRLEEAAVAFAQATSIDPQFFEAWSHLGQALFDQRRVQEALPAFERAAALRPHEPRAAFDVGKVLGALGRDEEAVGALRTSIALRPQSRAAREHLARALQRLGLVDELRALFEDWLEVLPDDAIARHLLATLEEPALPRASARYVRDTFDLFAEDFDAVLARLDYAAPSLIGEALARAGATPGAGKVLDAGCGTGLCAQHLRPLGACLVGVDLSPRMLARAGETGAYDELLEADLVEHLTGAPATYDIIAAADTFNYFGDLEPLLEAVAGAARPGALVVFTLEQGAQSHPAGYRLEATGRYTHARSYLDRCLSAAGLAALDVLACELRREAGVPVQGWVVSARRP